MPDVLAQLTRFSDVGITVIAVAFSLVTLIGAFRSGVLLQRGRFGSIEVEASAKEVQQAKTAIETVATGKGSGVPFETGQLASYYSQVLAQSRISFWFSLVFASIGFLIIVLAAFMHADAQAGSTIARFVAGGVVDAVAALFFVQSRRAQDSMAEFFDKLRRDRNHVEARSLCESLDSSTARDALRVRLALHYAEVGAADAISESIMKACLEGTRPRPAGAA